MTLETGYILNNRYRIVKLLGKGGFGAVYRAWDLNLNRPCAVKENLIISPSAQRQFNREASLLANLSHPGLPRVTDHFVIENQGQYLVMDFIEGEDLQSMLEGQGTPLDEDQVIGWTNQICDALSYLHAQNPPIIHRDIKPANIKITPAGKAVLVDFGIAKAYDAYQQTTIGARAVTPGYSPMEQYGHGRTDARSDIYALGATLYTLLTGHPPVESIQRSLGAFLERPQKLNPHLSSQVGQAILHAMELQPEHRFLNIMELKSALERQSVLEHVVRVQPAQGVHAAVRPAGRLTRVKAAPRRSPVLPILLIGGFVGILGVILLLFILLANSSSQDEISRNSTRTAAAFAEAVASTVTSQITATRLPSSTPPSIPATVTSLPTPSHTPTSAATLAPSLEPTLPPRAAVIEPYCAMFNQSPVRIQATQPVILWWRWDALTIQLVKEHMSAAIYDIRLDGAPVTADRQSEIEYLPEKKFYRVSWFADVGVLAPGIHRAERLLSWTKRISDGWTTFGPGGKIETEHDTCDIIVQ